MARRKCKPRIIPPQDKRICGSICFCQLIVVFSSVSLIYLTVAVYIPSYKTFNSGFETRPVMCQTINTSMINNCSWASCGEWCLTKTSGFCPQIHVTVRRNGTELQLSNCSQFTSVSCPQVNSAALKRYNCNNGTQCSTLHGVFNCSMGHCANMSEIYQCHYRADGFVLDSDKENIKMNGFFECRGSRCTKIRRAFSCDRFCNAIHTVLNNVYITMDDTLYTASCSYGDAFSTTDRSQQGEVLEDPVRIWKAMPQDVLMMSCYSIVYNETLKVINGTDCLNGTIFNLSDIPKLSMNFTTFWALSNRSRELLDHNQTFLPRQSALTIYNHSRLFINLDGCVNTLKGECKEFLQTNGRDGRNQTSQSRFPCYYNKNSSYMVVARYDLEKTWRQLIVSISIPTVLFVVSFFTLCVIMQSVSVGDDTKMRCKYCLSKTEDEPEPDENNGHVVHNQTNPTMNIPQPSASSPATNTAFKYQLSSPSSDGLSGSGPSSKRDFTPLVKN